MSVTTAFPVSVSERLELGPDIVRIPASWNEYLDLLEEAEYQIEYHNEEIILMSIASDPHEVIVGNIITCLNTALNDEPDMAVRGSNRHVFIKEFQKDYSPDAHIVKGEPIVHTLRKGLSANTNPWLVVEVLSPGTSGYDMTEKLPHYKKIPSLRHIMYIAQDKVLATVYNRKENSAVWENMDYDNLTDCFDVAGKAVCLKDVYNKVLFPGKPVSRK